MKQQRVVWWCLGLFLCLFITACGGRSDEDSNGDLQSLSLDLQGGDSVNADKNGSLLQGQGNLFNPTNIATDLGGLSDSLLNDSPCDGCTVAQFGMEQARFPLPSNSALFLLNQSKSAASIPEWPGVSPHGSIRIPFSGPIAYPFDGKHIPNQVELAGWAQQVYIVALGQPEQLIPIVPQEYGGSFKVVFQDNLHDLVLVPGASTFEHGKTYMVVVTNQLRDTQQKRVVADPKFLPIKSSSPITTFDPHEILRVLFQGVLESVLAQNSTQNIEDAILLFAFTVEEESSEILKVKDLYPSLVFHTAKDAASYLKGEEGELEVNESTEESLSGFAIPDQDVVSSLFENVAKVYRGHFQCRNLLSQQNSEWEINRELLGLLRNSVYTEFPSNCLKQPSAENSLSKEEHIDFWLTLPKLSEGETSKGVVLLQHGFTSSSGRIIDIADHLAASGFATIALDAFYHGTRMNTDLDGNGSINVKDSGLSFVRADRPDLTLGYAWQSLMDLSDLVARLKLHPMLYELMGIEYPQLLSAAVLTLDVAHRLLDVEDSSTLEAEFLKFDESLQHLALVMEAQEAGQLASEVEESFQGAVEARQEFVDSGLEDTDKLKVMTNKMLAFVTHLTSTTQSMKVSYIGQSLGGILGASLVSADVVPIERAVLNVPGGDMGDLFFNSPLLGQFVIKPKVSELLGVEMDSPEALSAQVQLELDINLTAISGGLEPLVEANSSSPKALLIQEVMNDLTIPNGGTQVLAKAFGTNSFQDGQGPIDQGAIQRLHWVFDPGNYSATSDAPETAGHTFFLDHKTTATLNGQSQAIEFLLGNDTPDPSLF